MSIEKDLLALRDSIVILTESVNQLSAAFGAMEEVEAEEVEAIEEAVAEEPVVEEAVEEPVVEEPVVEEAADDDFDLDDMMGEDPEPEVEVTLDEVRAVFRELATTKGRDAATTLLKKHKVTRLPDIKEAQYAAVYADVKKLLEE